VDKPLVWLYGEVKTPPWSRIARVQAGVLLRRLQRGDAVGMPHARPMPSVGSRCLELRVVDERVAWRILCRVDADAVVVADVFRKSTQRTPQPVIDRCRRRLRRYDQVARDGGEGDAQSQ
jgi:phage-related protein